MILKIILIVLGVIIVLIATPICIGFFRGSSNKRKTISELALGYEILLKDTNNTLIDFQSNKDAANDFYNFLFSDKSDITPKKIVAKLFIYSIQVGWNGFYPNIPITKWIIYERSVITAKTPELLLSFISFYKIIAQIMELKDPSIKDFFVDDDVLMKIIQENYNKFAFE